MSIPCLDRSRRYLKVLEGIGCLQREYKIYLNKDVPAVVHPPRRVPVPKKEAMRKELDKMVAEKIIAPVTESSDWVSSLLAILKKGWISPDFFGS